MKNKDLDFETKAIHVGQDPDPVTGAVIPPIYTTSTYAQESPGEHKGYDYSRTSNPTRHAFEVCVASLEEGEKAHAFSSGVAAISACVELLQPGDHIIAMDDLYGGTVRLFNEIKSISQGIEISYVDMSKEENIEASIKPNTKITGMNPEILERLRQQAAIQIKPRKNENIPEYILKDLNNSFGLFKLPKPSKGDIWFDLEGARDFVHGTKREYLFGVVYLDENNELNDFYWWAHTDEEEKMSFEKFVDWVEKRRKKFPDLHIYHYANYEKVAVRDLQQNYLTRMTEITDWLRNNLLIDLQPVVQNTIILGEESYSIKKVEKLYMNRTEDMQSAEESMVAYELWKNSGEPSLPGKLEDGLSPILEEIRLYNKDDLVSTYKLNKWLLKLKSDLNIEEQNIIQEKKKEEQPREIDIEASILFDEIPIQDLIKNYFGFIAL